MMATWIWLGVPLTVLIAIGAGGVRVGLVRRPGDRAGAGAASADAADVWPAGLAEGDERLVGPGTGAATDSAAATPRPAERPPAAVQSGNPTAGGQIPSRRVSGGRAAGRRVRATMLAGTTAGCEDAGAVPG